MTDQITEELRALRNEVDALKTQQSFPQLMTPRQTADFLHMSESGLRWWRKCREQGDRKGPPFMHMGGKTIFYDRDDVLEWARTHRVA